MQGSYKTIGGKLVVVDFTVEAGQFRQVLVHGDFFLYPDDAFEALAASLEGQSADLDEAAIAALVRAAIPEGTELIGTSPEAIATAIHRGLATEGAGS